MVDGFVWNCLRETLIFLFVKKETVSANGILQKYLLFCGSWLMNDAFDFSKLLQRALDNFDRSANSRRHNELDLTP